MIPAPIALGVNIDHIATLRNVRGTDYPDLLKAALMAEDAGAQVITLHLREDRRHIRDADLYILRPQLRTRMNLECAIVQEIIDIACCVKPHHVCLVPEKRQELTTEGGLDVIGHFDEVSAACTQLSNVGIIVSLFIEADPAQIHAAQAAGAPVIELHTGPYAHARDETTIQNELVRIQRSAALGVSLGLSVHAGHGLHYTNVQRIAAITAISELNIGHAIVAQAIFTGWENAIRKMKACMTATRGSL